MILKNLAPFLVMIALVVGVVVITTASLNYKLKKRIIESGKVNEDNVIDILKWNGSQSMLKWCLLLCFGGLGLIVLEFIPYNAIESPLPYGVESIFLAMGFGIYYLIVRKKN
jgi:hypothetical protein